jgi:DNA repair exonuclease SbcCD nuclease subunit
MVRFIQTSDWQIGMKGGGLGEAASLVRETRIQSIHNVLKAAQTEKVDFLLLCGDIFEHNMISQEYVKKVVTIFNQYPNIPLYILPGNHDIIGADCVYNRPIFQEIEHLTILNTSDSVEVADAVIHPCPILVKFSARDFSDVIPDVHKSKKINIGIAHGSLSGKVPVSNWEDIDLPIAASRVDKTGIDYLALGHWHSYRAFEDNAGIKRIVYSGTHEQTNYDEDGAGQCLLIQIDKKGDAPKIVSIKTGQLTWLCKEFAMRDASSIGELKNYLDSVKETNMVKLVLSGEIPLESKEKLDNMLEFQTTLHKNFRVKLESLNITLPLELESAFDLGDQTLNQTWTQLKQLYVMEPDLRKRGIITEALASLQRFGKEAEG